MLNPHLSLLIRLRNFCITFVAISTLLGPTGGDGGGGHGGGGGGGGGAQSIGVGPMGNDPPPMMISMASLLVVDRSLLVVATTWTRQVEHNDRNKNNMILEELGIILVDKVFF